jgi:hypothetical protein
MKKSKIEAQLTQPRKRGGYMLPKMCPIGNVNSRGKG